MCRHYDGGRVDDDVATIAYPDRFMRPLFLFFGNLSVIMKTSVSQIVTVEIYFAFAFRFSASLESGENVSVFASRAPTLFVTRALRDLHARAREPR